MVRLERFTFRQPRAYHLKKKEKERNAKPYKKKQPFIHETKETKKKSKTLKPKSYFPIKIHTHSNYQFFVVPSNTQIGLACSNLSNRWKKKKPLQ